jgi:hypothetical protein
MPSSLDCESDFGNWVECSKREGIAVVVLEAETGLGKTYVAQSVFDYLAKTTKSLDGSYWKPGLAPQWPQTNSSAIESTRKTIVPSNELRDKSQGNGLGFIWIGLPLGELSMATDLFCSQLDNLKTDCIFMYADKVRSYNRKTLAKTVAKEVGKTLLATTPIPAALSSLTAILKTGDKAFSDPVDSHRIEAREAVLNTISEIDDLASSECSPLVIVLDDAHAVDEETLQLLSFVTGLPTAASNDSEIQETTSQENSEWVQQSHQHPILIIATTWPSGSNVKHDGIFDQWLIDTRNILSNVSSDAFKVISIEPFSSDISTQMLISSGVDENQAKEITNHLGAPRDFEGVNPLVLTAGRATIDRNVDGGAFDEKLTSEIIKSLSTSPEFHTEQRLDDLRLLSDNGKQAHGLLTQLANWGQRVPMCAIDELITDSPGIDKISIADELVTHRFIRLPDDINGSFEMLTIQSDVHAHLVKSKTFIEPIQKAATGIRTSLLEHLHKEWQRDIPLIAWVDVLEMIRISEKLNPYDAGNSPGMDPTLDALLWWITVDRRLITNDHREILLKAASSMGRTGNSAANKLADLYDNPQDKINILTPHKTNPFVAMKLADLHNNRQDKINILTPHKTNPNVAMKLASLYRKKHKIEIFTPLAKTDPQIAMKLADLHNNPQDKINILTPHKTNPNVAMKLADLHNNRQDKINILTPTAKTNPKVAMKLADLYDNPQDKINALTPLAKTNLWAAIKLADLYDNPQDKINALTPLAKTYPNVAFQLAGLYDNPQDKINALTPLAKTDPKVAIKLADLYDNPQDKINIFTPLAKTHPNVAFKLTRLYDNPQDKINILTPLAKTHPNVAFNLSWLYDNPHDKIKILTPHKTNLRVAMKLADLYDNPQDKIKILTPHKTNPHVAIKLASLYDNPQDKINILTPLAKTDPNVAFKLASLYDNPQDKINILTPLAKTDPDVAMKLADLYDNPQDKINALTLLAKTDPDVAIKLADLYDNPQDKIKILTPHKTNPHVAIKLEDLIGLS